MSAKCSTETIPPGYKKTEVGVIPEDWDVKKLEELANIRSGGTPSTTQPQFWDGNLLWCTPTDITALKGCKYLRDTSRKITSQGLQSSSAEMIPVNSLIMTSRATIGECAINQFPVCTNQGFKNFVPLESVEIELLYYLLQTKKQNLISLCGGSTFLEIGKTQLANFKMQWPPIKAEQEAIAEALSDVDAFIESLEQLLAKKRHIKQGVMQELLTGKRRLPEFKVNPKYKQTEVGIIPEDWELVRIGAIAAIEGGFAFSSKNFLSDGKYQVVKMSNLYGGSLDLERSASYLNELSDQENHYLLQHDDILITLTGTIGKRDYGYSYKINNERNLLLNQRVCRLIVGQEAVASYVAFQIKTPYFLDQFFNVAKGGTGNQTNVGTKDIEEIRIPAPSRLEQEAIAAILSEMDSEITALEKKLGKARQIKQGMMQELLTGRIRLI